MSAISANTQSFNTVYRTPAKWAYGISKILLSITEFALAHDIITADEEDPTLAKSALLGCLFLGHWGSQYLLLSSAVNLKSKKAKTLLSFPYEALSAIGIGILIGSLEDKKENLCAVFNHCETTNSSFIKACREELQNCHSTIRNNDRFLLSGGSEGSSPTILKFSCRNSLDDEIVYTTYQNLREVICHVMFPKSPLKSAYTHQDCVELLPLSTDYKREYWLDSPAPFITPLNSTIAELNARFDRLSELFKSCNFDRNYYDDKKDFLMSIAIPAIIVGAVGQTLQICVIIRKCIMPILNQKEMVSNERK